MGDAGTPEYGAFSLESTFPSKITSHLHGNAGIHGAGTRTRRQEMLGHAAG